MSNPVVTSEYSAVRNGGAGLIDLTGRGRILVSGSEAVTFLNGLVTNDMKTLALNAWMPAAFANVQGRLLATVRIIHRRDGFLLDTDETTREKVISLLRRFTLAEDFRVSDLSTETAAFSVQGRKAVEIIAAIFGDEAATVPRQKAVSTRFGVDDVSIIRATQTGEDGFDLIVDGSVAPQLREALLRAGAVAISEEIAETLRIEAGIPRYGVDMDETTIVTETNLDDAVSFTKGCYLGQEIIVRIKHRGHVANKLTGIILQKEETAENGATIVSSEGKEIGRITSSSFSPGLDRTIALGYVKYDYLKAGNPVKIVAGGQSLAGAVTDLPLVRGRWYEN